MKSIRRLFVVLALLPIHSYAQPVFQGDPTYTDGSKASNHCEENPIQCLSTSEAPSPDNRGYVPYGEVSQFSPPGPPNIRLNAGTNPPSTKPNPFGTVDPHMIPPEAGGSR